jgi:hypothetical protein
MATAGNSTPSIYPRLGEKVLKRWRALTERYALGEFKPFGQALLLDLSEDPTTPGDGIGEGVLVMQPTEAPRAAVRDGSSWWSLAGRWVTSPRRWRGVLIEHNAVRFDLKRRAEGRNDGRSSGLPRTPR